MKTTKKKLLLVEDDLNLGYLLVDFLESEDYEVKLARDGEDGYRFFLAEKFALCIFDVMLPKKDGFTLATEVRKINTEIPIIFLTAKSFTEDKLKGFKAGADDYITKPFNETELLCRIEAILRRTEKFLKEETVYAIGEYSFDYLNQSITHHSGTRRITAKESEVLKLLCQSKNQILKRHEALTSLYGRNDYFLGRSFDVFITRLRKYLQEDPSIRIENIHGIGFILTEEKTEK